MTADDVALYTDNEEPQGAVLEISLPVTNLEKVFKLYRQKMHAQNIDITFLEDEFEMHLAKTGRSRKRGPTIDWLINHLFYYLEDFTLDIGNRALDYISYCGFVYEDQQIKHITKRMIYSKNYLLRKYDDDTYGLQKEPFIRDDRYYRADERISFLNEEDSAGIINETDPFRTYWNRVNRQPLKKVRTMIAAGLTLEAVCLLNGYIEVSYKIAFRLAFPNDAKRKDILSMKHKDVLNLVKSINFQCCDPYSLKVAETYRKHAHEIYRHRNDYLHALELPEGSVFMTNSTRASLESLMNTFLFDERFGHYIGFYRDNPQIQKLILNEISKKD
jgi:hypothetical protein